MTAFKPWLIEELATPFLDAVEDGLGALGHSEALDRYLGRHASDGLAKT